MSSIRVLPLLAIVNASALAGCAGNQATPRAASASVSAEPKETVVGSTPRDVPLRVPLAAKSSSTLSGTAVFTEVPEGVRVVIEVAGLSPGKHATHIHEKGDCSAPDATSAGEHFNPEGHPHGLPSSALHHIGDLGNIVVGDDGKGRHEVTAPGASLRPNDARSYANRAIIVHEKVDDGGQPSGNAGGRVGCGEIRR